MAVTQDDETALRVGEQETIERQLSNHSQRRNVVVQLDVEKQLYFLRNPREIEASAELNHAHHSGITNRVLRSVSRITVLSLSSSWYSILSTIAQK